VEHFQIRRFANPRPPFPAVWLPVVICFVSAGALLAIVNGRRGERLTATSPLYGHIPSPPRDVAAELPALLDRLEVLR
jgi:hypothetical protein